MSRYPIPRARTATADGTGTGQIAVGTQFVNVTSGNAAHIVMLPTPTPGTRVSLRNGATGYVLDSAVTINGAANLAIPANTLAECFCDTAGTWVCELRSDSGVESFKNLIPNGDFEAGITGWAASSGATIAHNVDDWAWSGTGCLEITTAGSGALEGASVVFGGAFGYLAVVAGEIYCAEAVVATEDDHVMALRVGFDQGSTRIIGYARESTISRECISGIFVVPPGATFLDSFALLTTATAAGQVYVDEVRLIRLGTVA